MFEDPAVMRIVQGRPSLKVIHTVFLAGWLELVAYAVLKCDLFGLSQEP